MKKFLNVVLVASLLTACASKELALHGQKEAGDLHANVKVSAERVDDYSDPYNLLLQVNFESNDGNWVRVDDAQISFDTEDPYNIVVGKDLVTWADAKAEQKKMDTYNRNTTVGLVAMAGGAAAVLGILTNREALAAVGVTTVAMAGSYDTYSKIKDARDKVQGTKLVPEGHLYSSFAVPSMSLVKRWVLINCPSGNVGRYMRLKLKTVEGETVTYKIDLLGKS